MNSANTFESTILSSRSVDDLLALLRSNLKKHISPETAQAQGFLTFEYTKPMIERMMADMAQPVIMSGNTLAGYALATSISACTDIEIMRPTMELAATLTLNGSKVSGLRHYFIGQICVADGWRGQGLFDALYKAHKERFAGSHDCLITEINAANTRSHAAHARVGFQIIHSYTDGGAQWDVVAWDWRAQ
ncbi:MAG: GNAT family N-acetyltransferase [Chitinophaga sp.]|uniref:GNAT family N-acetyltransferase n=1 Tax=Chitinophaga sp. TaxID=1869181 RepID=UPI001B2ED8AC|nr:GNAT family N-acetyltransferase [Chitinophaga sp.]MBO9729551.1 GNAT family N-acetyltransferase [Chitinophaga sp.]